MERNMHLGFILHSAKGNNAQIAGELAEQAHALGFLCSAEKDAKDASGYPFLDIERENIDFVISVGGDGSVLSASDFAAQRGVPLLAVNNGRVGFLTEIEPKDFGAAIIALRDGKYRTVARMMLECTAGNKAFTSLNDFTAYKKSFAEVAHLNISVDGIDAGDVFCDGIVVSTPTGATGYSISAGGPIIAPGMDCVLITPICPHSLGFRPIVAKDTSVVRIKAYSDCLLARAGEPAAEISTGDSITIKKSEMKCEFVVLGEKNLYSLIRSKLK